MPSCMRSQTTEAITAAGTEANVEPMASRLQETGGAAKSLAAVSGLEHIDTMARALQDAINELLAISDVHYYDINQGSSVVFIGWNDWQWVELPDEAAPLVGVARQALSRLEQFASRAAEAAPDRLNDLEKLHKQFSRVIEQPNGSYPGGAPASSIDEIREKINAAVADYGTTVRRLPNAHGKNERLLVADTSALLDRPDLQAWRLEGGSWTVVLLPQVHSELDERKRDPRTREAAQKVINQIEDFARRGDTVVGVPLAGRLKLREVPTSPDMSKTLPWLRPEVPDDAIIAGALELVWRDLTAQLAVAASDRNLRNKARLAGLGVVHPDHL